MAVAAEFRGSVSYTSTTEDASGSLADALGPVSLSFLPGAGTGANQCDAAFREARTLTGAAHTYTLSAPATGVVMARLRMAFVYVQPVSAGVTTAGATLAIAPGVTHGWPGLAAAALLPGSVTVLTWPAASGSPCPSGSADQVTFTATGTVAFVVAFVGCSA